MKKTFILAVAIFYASFTVLRAQVKTELKAQINVLLANYYGMKDALVATETTDLD